MALSGSSGGNAKTSQSAVKAGEAFFELNVSDSKAFKILARFGDRIKSIGSTIRNVGLGVAAIGGGMLTPLVGLFASAAEYASNIDKLSEKLNGSAEAVTAMKFAAESSGIELNDFSQAVLKLNQAAIAASKGSLDQAVAFEQMGIKAEDFIGLDVDQKIRLIAEAFDKASDPMQQTQLLFKLFGEDANKLLPLFAKGSDGIQELANEAERLGLVMNSEDARKGRELHENFSKVLKSLKVTILEVGFALFGFNGSVNDGAKTITMAIQQIRTFIQENAGIIRVIAMVAAGLVAGGTAVAVFGTALTGLVTIIGLVKTATLALIAAAFSPIILKIVAITGLLYLLTDGFTGFKTEVDGVRAFFVQAFQEIWEVFNTTFEGIFAALKSGNFKLAFQIFAKGIETIWATLMLNLRKGWNGVMIWMVDSLKKNPWILPLLSSLAGAAAGGPAGAAAGALLGLAGAGAIEVFEKEIKNALAAPTAEAEAKVAGLKNELTALANQAKKEAAALKPAGPGERKPVDPRDMQISKSLGVLGDAVRGTFGSGDYKGTLGIGPANEIAKKQFQVQKQIRDELIKLNKKPGLAFE